MRTLCVLMFLATCAGACAGPQVASPLAEARAKYAEAGARKAMAEAKAAEAKAAEEAAKTETAAKGKVYASVLVTDASEKVAAAKAALALACQLDTAQEGCSARNQANGAFIEARVTGFSVNTVTRMGTAPAGWSLYVEGDHWVALLVSGETRAKLVKTGAFRPGLYRFYRNRVERVGD